MFVHMPSVQPGHGAFRFAILLLLTMCLGLSSCSTYHKVAVWYKYRKDFHLPKDQGDRHAIATAPSRAEISNAQEVPLSFNQPTGTRHKPSLLARIAKKRLARQAVLTVPEEQLSASISAAPNPGRKPIWQRDEPQQANPAMASDDRPFHWSAIVGFVLSLCILPSFILLLSYLFGLFLLVLIGAFVFSIISLFHTGPGKPFRGRGLGIAGLVISIVDVFLLFLLILLIIIALGSL